MDTPEEFKRLVQSFWQGSRREYPNHSAWLRAGVGGLTTHERTVSKKFLDGLLATATEDEMLAVWRSGAPDYWIKPIRPFFAELSSVLGQLSR